MRERNNRVYLAGHITNDPRSVEWRKKAYHMLHGVFDVITPLRNRDKPDILSDPIYTASDGMVATNTNPRSIVARDYHDVTSSYIILVNLEQYSDRPSWGTIFELAWAYIKRIPVIAFGADDQMKIHPFFRAAVTEFHDTFDEAVGSLLSYWA